MEKNTAFWSNSGSGSIYKEKIEDHFTSRDTARIWQGIHHLTNLRGSRDPPTAANTSLAEELNHLFARFERGPNERTSLQLDPADQPLTLKLEEVKRALRIVNARKAAGPDEIPGRVLQVLTNSLGYSQTFLTFP